MRCPYCGFAPGSSRRLASRVKRRTRFAAAVNVSGCNKRFTTYERIDEIPYMVVKKDGRREKFDRQKVLSGLLHACEKRPICSAVKLEEIVDSTEAFVVDSPERERSDQVKWAS